MKHSPFNNIISLWELAGFASAMILTYQEEYVWALAVLIATEIIQRYISNIRMMMNPRGMLCRHTWETVHLPHEGKAAGRLLECTKCHKRHRKPHQGPVPV